MKEKLTGQEEQEATELAIDTSIIEVLSGKISKPIKTASFKPGFEGKTIEVRLSTEGAGMFGLTDWQNNKEWSGIINHVLLSARYSLHFAQKLPQTEHRVNPQRILNGMMASHSGRRVWDEANWYPYAIADAQEKKGISNETLGMQIVQGKIPQDAFELIVALGHNVEGFSVDPSIFESLDYRITSYVDHRTTQKYEPLHIRMGDFLLGNFFEKNKINLDLKEKVYSQVKDIIERQKHYKLRKPDAKEVTLEEADKIAETLGANPNSSRLNRTHLMRLILQDADTEALLIQSGINPEDINDQTVPIPTWEQDFRQQYIEYAKESILKRLQEIYEEQKEAHEENKSSLVSTQEILEKDFPLNTWWGQYARKLWSQEESN